MAKGVKAVKRVTRKELKEDKLVTTYFQTRKYIEQHQAALFKIALAAAAVIIFGVFVFGSKKRSGEEAAKRLDLVLLSIPDINSPAAVAALDTLTQIADRFSGTKAGDDALFYIARLKYQTGQPDSALIVYDTYLKQGNKDSYLYPAALAGRAAIYEDQGRLKEAAEAYVKAADHDPRSFYCPDFRLAAGRCFRLAGELEKARTQLQSVIDNFPETAFASRAKLELPRVEAKTS